MEEIWKPIPEYPGYEASNLGRVRSETYGILKPTVNGKGYFFVTIKNKRKRVHRLMMFAFVGPCPEGMEVCHNDGDPGNNNLDNLRYATHKENMKDKALHGTLGNITVEQAKEIREKAAAGVPGVRLVRQYGTGGLSISRLLHGITYIDAGGPIKDKDYTYKYKGVEKIEKKAAKTRERNERVKKIRVEYKETDITLARLGEKNGLTEDAVSKIVRGLRGKRAGGPIKGIDY